MSAPERSVRQMTPHVTGRPGLGLLVLVRVVFGGSADGSLASTFRSLRKTTQRDTGGSRSQLTPDDFVSTYELQNPSKP